MFSLVVAFLLLSYTGMVYVLSCRGFLDVIVWCTAFFLLSYTGMVYVLSCRGFLVVIVHRDGVCSLYVDGLPCRGFLDVIVHRDGVCSLL